MGPPMVEVWKHHISLLGFQLIVLLTKSKYDIKMETNSKLTVFGASSNILIHWEHIPHSCELT